MSIGMEAFAERARGELLGDRRAGPQAHRRDARRPDAAGAADRAARPRRPVEPGDRRAALPQPAHRGVAPPQGVHQARDPLPEAPPGRAAGTRRAPDLGLNENPARGRISRRHGRGGGGPRPGPPPGLPEPPVHRRPGRRAGLAPGRPGSEPVDHRPTRRPLSPHPLRLQLNEKKKSRPARDRWNASERWAAHRHTEPQREGQPATLTLTAPHADRTRRTRPQPLPLVEALRHQRHPHPACAGTPPNPHDFAPTACRVGLQVGPGDRPTCDERAAPAELRRNATGKRKPRQGRGFSWCRVAHAGFEPVLPP